MRTRVHTQTSFRAGSQLSDGTPNDSGRRKTRNIQVRLLKQAGCVGFGVRLPSHGNQASGSGSDGNRERRIRWRHVGSFAHSINSALFIFSL